MSNPVNAVSLLISLRSLCVSNDAFDPATWEQCHVQLQNAIDSGAPANVTRRGVRLTDFDLLCELAENHAPNFTKKSWVNCRAQLQRTLSAVNAVFDHDDLEGEAA